MKKTRHHGLPGMPTDKDHWKTSTCKNPLTMTQLTEHYKKRQRSYDEKLDKSCNKGFPRRRNVKQPCLLKLPKIVAPVSLEQESNTMTDKKSSKTKELRLPVIKSENIRKTSIRREYQPQNPDKGLHSISESPAGLQRETPLRPDREHQNKKEGSANEEKSDKRGESGVKTESLDNLKVPTADADPNANANDGLKRISCNEYTKKMMLRKKKPWKERRKEAKLFDINLLNPHRAMLTSSATARGLKVLKANEVIIYRFCLSNYSDVDIHTVTE